MAKKLKIALGADHAGFRLKDQVREYLRSKGVDVEDFGATSEESVDYPDFAEKVAHRVSRQEADFGVLVCGTGIGMAMSANKLPGVRAANCNDTLSAFFARRHNNANVLALGGRLADIATARKIIDTWLETPFEGGRHERRVKKIVALENSRPEKKA
jgi:ribose 5-phosphate isomerase B